MLRSPILQAYISVLYDEKRATVTTSKSTASSLLQLLKEAGVTAADVALHGRFHCQCYHDDVEPFIKFCDSQSAFQFPDASRLVLPTRSNSGGDYITHGKLHHIALRSILVEQSNWCQTLAAVYCSQLTDNESLIVSIGPERCVPPTLMRKLGSRLVHLADLDMATPRFSASVLDPNAPLKHQKGLSDNDIAVVGMSCKVAGADNLEEFWKLLCDGKSQHIEVPSDRFGFETTWRDIDPKRKWYGNFIKDHDAFDHKFFKKSPREIASTDPQQRLMLQTAYQAVEQSGYFHALNQDRHIGCYIGVGCVDYEHNIACYPPNAFSATGNLKSFVAGKISHYFGWTGPGLTIDTACSASAVAVHQACKAILSGECTAALAGGVTVMTSPHWFQNLAGASFLSPTGPCKPFDAKADGYCRGEGIGAVFLKKMSSALADGDQILGVIGGTAVYQNQNCTPITVPNAESLSDLFRNVTRQARLEPRQISAVEAHGTGTPVGDPAEYESIRQVFGGSIRANILSLGSVKGLVGHTECASGIIALIKTLLMVQEGAIPPQASFSTINPSIKASPLDNIEIVTSVKPWEPDFRAALINNYGASGSNASMVITQAPRRDPKAVQKSSIHSSNMKHPFWFCGFDDQNLRVYSARFRQFLKHKIVSAKNLSIANLAFNVFRQSNRSLGRALVFSCSSVNELEEKLTAFENGAQSISPIACPPPRPVVLCFGGQISKFVGLDRQVYESVTILRSYLDQCSFICQSIGLDGIYPEIFQRTPVEDIVKLQTMLFAIQYSCAKSWIDCGIQVAAVVGHSFGELTALCVSGVLCLKDAVKMIAGRARLIRDSWGAEKGSMMAVEANLEDVASLLAESSKACQEEQASTIACFNGPRSFTLAGSAKSIDAVGEIVRKNPAFSASMKTKKLNVTNAFHSTLVEPLMADLENVAQNLTFREPTIPLERATESGSTDRLTPRLVAEHMRYPVYFNHAVQRLVMLYPSCVWLEAGSNSTITTMASRALGQSSTSHFQSVNITCDNALQFLTDATTNLWKEGLSVAFWPHHSTQTSEYAPVLLPPYQFEKSRHWMDLKKPQNAVAEPATQTQTQEELPQGLWTFVGYQDSKQRSARFRINTMVKKFEDYVSGHTIAQAAPLCPSTLQLDIVIEALMSLRPDFATSDFQPQLQGLDNHAPMCIDRSRLVWLDVEASEANPHVWNWKMVSNTAQESSATTLHVSGRIVFRSADDALLQSDFARYERLVGHQRCLRLLDGNDADDVIQGRNIYKTFAEIVDYGEVYRGVQKIVGKDNESAGRVVKVYTGETWLDTPLSDSFCQVAGIFVNCMADRSDKDICISNRIEQWIRSPKLRAGDSRPEIWDVFAHHHRPSEKEFLSDVFIFDSRNGALLEIILGISYRRVSKAALGKALSGLTPGAKKSEPATAPSVPANIESCNVAALLSSAKVSKPAKPPAPKKKKSTRPDISSSVRNLLADVSGLEANEINDETGLVDIGIDSLMGMELARDIESVFKCSLDIEALNDVTDFQSLTKSIQSALALMNNNATSKEESAEDDEELESQNEDVQPEQSTAAATPESQSEDMQSEQSNAAPYVTNEKLSKFLAEQLGVAESDMAPETHLHALGVDSYLSIELRVDIAAELGVEIPDEVAIEELTVKELDARINGQAGGASQASSASTLPNALGGIPYSIGFTPHIDGISPRVDGVSSSTAKDSLNLQTATILEAFGESKEVTDQFISKYKFGDYADYVLPKQTELCIAHIVEAFEQMGCSLRTAELGQKLERVRYLPKHERFVEYLYMMLEKGARLIDMDGSQITRTAISTPAKSADMLLQNLIHDFPDHANDHKLTYLTGSKLADCLTGKSDGIQLIFGSAEGRDLVSGLYGRSPINVVWLKQMEDFIKRLISKLPMHEGPLKIFEMGAGTGGTTVGMASLLASLNVPVEYTFSDLSPSLVAAARKRFKQYSFMKFRVHDIEKPPATDLFHSQHIVISNNCVHATHSLTNSTKNIHSALRPDGFLMMLEMTDTLYWVDMIFGLFEGWWLFDDGRQHAVTHQSLWEKSMQSVGYGHVDWTEGNRPEANLQRIIIALASGPRYDRLPKAEKPLQSQTADCTARQATVDHYIREYTQDFSAPVPSKKVNSLGPSDQCVLVTGATGSLGSHLVSHFVDLPSVKTVVCLNRRSMTEPAHRQRQAIESRGISLDLKALSKLKVFETNTAKTMLGLPSSEYEHLVNSVTHIVHNAWPVSIKRPMKGFESQLQVMKNLIDLARKISCSRSQELKVGFQFVSSIATVGHYPLWSGKARVPEEMMTVDSVLPSGYGDAKLICERMLDETLHKHPDRFRPMAVRIGQIAGSKTSGYWNPVEHLSFLIKSSQTLKALPDFEGARIPVPFYLRRKTLTR